MKLKEWFLPRTRGQRERREKECFLYSSSGRQRGMLIPINGLKVFNDNNSQKQINNTGCLRGKTHNLYRRLLTVKVVLVKSWRPVCEAQRAVT